MDCANYNLPLKNGWKFHLGEIETLKEISLSLSHETSQAGGAVKELDMFGKSTEWKDVALPHDWMTEQKQ